MLCGRVIRIACVLDEKWKYFYLFIFLMTAASGSKTYERSYLPKPLYIW